MILQSREPDEFCIEVFFAIEPAVNDAPSTGRKINHCKIAFPYELIYRPVSFRKQVVQFDLRSFRSDASQTIANSSRGAVVPFPETRCEDQYSFFHSLSGHGDANWQTRGSGKWNGSLPNHSEFNGYLDRAK